MQDVTLDNKLRLLMIAASIYPEKFEGEKGLNLMKVGIIIFYSLLRNYVFHISCNDVERVNFSSVVFVVLIFANIGVCIIFHVFI